MALLSLLHGKMVMRQHREMRVVRDCTYNTVDPAQYTDVLIAPCVLKIDLGLESYRLDCGLTSGMYFSRCVLLSLEK